MRKKGGFFYAGTEIHTRVYCALTGLLRVEGKYTGASPHFVAFCLSGANVRCGIVIPIDQDDDDFLLHIIPLQNRDRNSPEGNHIIGKANGLAMKYPPTYTSPERAE